MDVEIPNRVQIGGLTMTLNTKKVKIDPNSKEEADALDTTSDLYRKFSEYERQERDETNQRKNRIAAQLEAMGEEMLDEIDQKHELKEQERMDMIDVIIDKTKDNLVRPKELYTMSYEDVKSIYVKAQDYNKSWGRILLEFVMGW